jgi:UDP-glucose 4-epimerase
LVTGGAGFIGSHLVDRLIAAGEVVVFDNLTSGKHEFLSQHRCNPRLEFVRGDLLDMDRLEKALAGCDFVFHLAANPDIRVSSIERPDTDLKQGTIATFNVLEAMRRADVRKIAFSSSSVVYGEPTTIPTPENYGALVPISLYGASKLAAEGLISAYCGTFGLQTWIFRFANIVGSRATHGILVDFHRKLSTEQRELEVLGDGNQAKSYLLVEDCVDGMLFGIQHSNQPVNIFNLGSEDNVRVARIAEIFLREMGLNETEIRYTGGRRGWRGDVPLMQLDVTRMTALGWKARHSSEEAITLAARELVKCRQ